MLIMRLMSTLWVDKTRIFLAFFMLLVAHTIVQADELTLRPNADGTTFGWTGSNACVIGNWSACVNETTQDGDITYLYVTQSGGREFSLNVQDSNQTRFISNVTVYEYLKTGDNENYRILIVTDLITYYIPATASPLSTTFTLYTGIWPISPGGGNWTWANISALEVGTASSNTGPFTNVSVTQIWVNVTYGSLFDSRDPAPNSTDGTFTTSENLTVNGSGWNSNQPIDVRVNDSVGATVCTESLQAGSNGNFTNKSFCELGSAAAGTAEIFVSTDNMVTWLLYDSFTITVDCGISLGLSSNLTGGINWTIPSIPIFNESALGNNGTGNTTYNITVTASGCNADLWIRANADLKTSDELYSIGLDNETYRWNQTNQTVPISPGNSFTSLTTNFALIKSGLSGTSNIYFKFFLNVTGGQAPGIYNNTVYIKANKSA